MVRPASKQPTDVELQILRILWAQGPSTVRQVHERMTAAKDIRYATTVKMLGVMLEKGLVKRDESARPLVYRAAVGQRQAQQGMLNDLIRKAYDGSAMSLVMQALSSKRATPEELAEVRRLLDELQEGDQ